ncbi:hypothetical protein D9611_012393 [Ephemerocybe angulata]|uniref:Ribonuclease H1 N-terminal domain-containing protein n=1 Tax=Ephemerocybe angulata TaxID=980116 RepID=A0A8H5FKE8_9AGAR|nr:hypothetical protein D9611_012393 [Tulosesus angulatus]
MAGHSNVKEEGAAAILGRATVSPAMLRLLGNLIRAIDARHLVLDEHISLGGSEAEPITCPRCRGTGVTMIYSASDFDDDDEFDDNDVPNRIVHPSLPALTVTPGAAGPSLTSGAAAPVTAAAPAPVGAAAASNPPATPAAGTAPSGPAPPSAAAAPVTTATVSVGPAAQVPFPVSATVPLPVSPTPGFHSLGPNVPAPTPPNAVYTDSSVVTAALIADRFYTVTRGIRVGVFGGWMNTSPNVTGVPAASYTRHRTLQAAYEAYVSAYNSGIVTHA